MKKETSGGLVLVDVLFIAFLVLKLTNVINWSWWWITAPVWIPIAIVILTVALKILVEVIKSNRQ